MKQADIPAPPPLDAKAFIELGLIAARKFDITRRCHVQFMQRGISVMIARRERDDEGRVQYDEVVLKPVYFRSHELRWGYHPPTKTLLVGLHGAFA